MRLGARGELVLRKSFTGHLRPFHATINTVVYNKSSKGFDTSISGLVGPSRALRESINNNTINALSEEIDRLS